MRRLAHNPWILWGIFAICIPVQLVCAIMIVMSARARLAILVMTIGAIPSILADGCHVRLTLVREHELE